MKLIAPLLLIFVMLSLGVNAVTFTNNTNLNYDNVTYKFNKDMNFTNSVSVYDEGVIFNDTTAINISFLTNFSFINNTIDNVTDLYNNFTMLGDNNFVNYSGNYNRSDLRLYYNHEFYDSGTNFTALNQTIEWFVTDLNATNSFTRGFLNQTTTHFLNISFADPTFNTLDAEFFYDGVNKTSSVIKTVVSNSLINFEVTVDINSTDDKLFDWNVTLNTPTRNFNVTGNQSIEQFSFFLCDASGNITMILNILDEDNPDVPLVSDVDAEIKFWVNDEENAEFLNLNMSGASTYYICINPDNATFISDLYFIYNNPNGFFHRYYDYNRVLNSTPHNISMYNFNRTANLSELDLTSRFRDTFEEFPNVLAKLQRRYLAEGVFRTVQMDQSGNFGQMHFNIIENTQDYKLTFENTDNCELGTSLIVKFNCDSGLCTRDILLDLCGGNVSTASLSAETSFDNSTGILRLDWSKVDGTNTNVNFIVSKALQSGSLIVCNSTQSGVSSGLFTCNVSSFNGDVFVQLLENNLPVFGEFVPTYFAFLSSVLPRIDSAFFGMLTMVLFIGIGIVGAEAVIISTVVGLIISFFFGLFNAITLTFIIIGSAIGILIGYKLRNRL